MAGNTPRGISYPTSDDKIRDGSSPSALADDFMGLAGSADAAISQAVQESVDASKTYSSGLEASARTSADQATAAAASAQALEGDLTDRVAAVEAAGGLSPSSPVDGQTADLILQDGTLTNGAVGSAIDIRGAQADYVSLLEAGSSLSRVQVVKVDSGEALQVVAHSLTGQFTNHLIEGTNAGSGRDDYRIVGDIYSGRLPVKSVDYNGITRTGTYLATADQFGYTTQVGATWDVIVNVPFRGAEVRVYPYKDNRGGVWKFTLGSNVTEYSTYAASGAQETNGFLVSTGDLPRGNYTLKAEFLGDDPVNPPSTGAGTSRGWLARTPGTNTFPGTYELVKSSDQTGGWAQGTKQGVESNREFAWWLKRSGTTQTAQWVPFHGIDTAFNAEPARFYDGDRELNIFRMGVGEKADLTGPFKMVQHVYGRHPDEPTVNLLDIWTTTTIHPTGRMTIEGRIKVNFDIEITHPYVLMNPVNSAVFDTIISSVGNTYPNTPAQQGTNTWLPESDWGESWLFLSSTTPDQAAAFRYNNPVESVRRGGTNKPAENTRSWLEHRTGGVILKHYQKLWATGAVIPAGAVHRFSGDYIHVVQPNAYGGLAKA